MIKWLSIVAQVRGELLDWTQPYMGEKFDIVMACDVLYEVYNSLPLPCMNLSKASPQVAQSLGTSHSL